MGHGHDHEHSHDDLFEGALEHVHDLFEESEQAMYLFMDDELKACNARFAKLLGYKDPNEWSALGDVPRSFVADESIDDVIEAFQNAVGRGMACEIPVTWKSKAGKPVRTSAVFVPFDVGGHRLALHFVTPL